MSAFDWFCFGMYMLFVTACCLFFGLLYVAIYAVLMIFEVIPNALYKIWKEIKNERDTRRKDF